MKVYYSLDEFSKLENAIVTIGNFDGVHLGHIQVLRSLTQPDNSQYESVVITFWPHPKQVLDPSHGQIKCITSIHEKIHLIENTGIKHLILLPFTKNLAEMSAMNFVEDILISRIGVKKIILGYDHRFGKDRAGGLEFLEENNSKFKLIIEEIPKIDAENISISTSKIKYYLSIGHIKEANKLLGRNFSFKGTVIEGKKLGRTIGFPTANIKLEIAEKILPSNGVYVVIVHINRELLRGMMNIGYRPTVSGTDLSIEVNIFDFHDIIYEKEIIVEVVEYLRAERKFPSLNELIKQLEQDKADSIKYFRSEK